MPRRRVAPATELFTSPADHLFPGETYELVLAPGTASGYKGVSMLTDELWQARMTINGKVRHVCTGSDPRECAWVLARLQRFLCLLPSQKKEHGVAAVKGADVDGLWEHCDGRAVMCSEQQAVRQSVPVCGEKRVAEHVKVPSVRRVCTVDRMPLSPVKNMKV